MHVCNLPRSGGYAVQSAAHPMMVTVACRATVAEIESCEWVWLGSLVFCLRAACQLYLSMCFQGELSMLRGQRCCTSESESEASVCVLQKSHCYHESSGFMQGVQQGLCQIESCLRVWRHRSFLHEQTAFALSMTLQTKGHCSCGWLALPHALSVMMSEQPFLLLALLLISVPNIVACD